MKTETPPDTRSLILLRAAELFYGEGIRAISMDRIAEAVGVTKKTLYYHFRSKDDLIEAYLVARDGPNLAAFARWYDKAEGQAPDRIAALFQGLARQAKSPRWRGCGFLRTAAELANMPGHPAVKAGAAHKKKLEAWLARTLDAEGACEPQLLARQVALLIEGLFSTLLFHRDPAYAEAAANAARVLVAQALQRNIGTPSADSPVSTSP